MTTVTDGVNDEREKDRRGGVEGASGVFRKGENMVLVGMRGDLKAREGKVCVGIQTQIVFQTNLCF